MFIYQNFIKGQPKKESNIMKKDIPNNYFSFNQNNVPAGQ